MSFSRFISFVLGMILVGFCSPMELFAASSPSPPLVAAIFVQNKAGETLADQVDTFNDFLTTRLTEKGFSIIDRVIAIEKFRDSKNSAQIQEDQLRRLVSILENSEESSVEASLDGASALRISQMLGADYLIIASLSSFGSEVKDFKGYGVENVNTEFRLRISLKVLEGRQGGTLYGDTITAKLKKNAGKNLTITTDDILPELLDNGAIKLAENVSEHVGRISATPVKSLSVIEFTANSNVEATIELDGAVIGVAPGRFYASPGLHQIRFTGQWLTPWEKTVNVSANQVLSVTLQLSEEGQRRFASLEQLKIELDRAKKDVDLTVKERENQIAIDREQSEADAFSKKREAEGRKAMLEESHIRIEGLASQPDVDRNVNINLQK